MVLYFTGTGNSRHIAERIAHALNDTLISLNDRIKSGDITPLAVNGRLVLVMPTYAWRIPRIVREGMQVTATGIHSSMQGFMAAKAGARYVAPYVNRMDNYGIDGVRVASEIHRTLRSYDLKADVLAASFKNSEQVLELVRQGVGAITAAPDVLAALIKNPATDAAIADQNRDFGFLVGERRTWLDLIKEK